MNQVEPHEKIINRITEAAELCLAHRVGYRVAIGCFKIALFERAYELAGRNRTKAGLFLKAPKRILDYYFRGK